VTLEDEEMLRAFEEASKEFATRFMGDNFLFIDEAQYCKEVGRKIKLIYDLFSDKQALCDGFRFFRRES